MNFTVIKKEVITIDAHEEKVIQQFMDQIKEELIKWCDNKYAYRLKASGWVIDDKPLPITTKELIEQFLYEYYHLKITSVNQKANTEITTSGEYYHMDIKKIQNAITVLKDLAFSDTKIQYPEEFEALRTGVQALNITKKLPKLTENISQYYLDMVDGKKTISIEEYNNYVLTQISKLYEI